MGLLASHEVQDEGDESPAHGASKAQRIPCTLARQHQYITCSLLQPHGRHMWSTSNPFIIQMPLE